ncbi:MAG: hypothetical protein KA795_09875 [Burkholderiaceae bacterium]|nr:hypothetical protein [Burkholderiaceae bacterium]
MSDTRDPFGFGKFVPGFDFLQSLARQPAGGMPQMPGMPGWVAPTLDVEEIERRIEELRAVQFWLEQNTTALKATLQALEVQKMTLAALRGMNFNMDDMAAAFRAHPAAKPFDDMSRPITPERPPAAAAPAAAPAPAPTAPAKKKRAPRTKAGGAADGVSKPAGGAPSSPVADPLQWWGALTEQFQQIASGAMHDATRQAGAPRGPFANAFASAPVSTPTSRGTASASKPAGAARKKAASSKGKTPAAPRRRRTS